MKDEDYPKFNRLLQQCRGERTYPQFFNDLFVRNGYDCEEFLDECWYGGERLRCCDIFRSYYVMLRGRCFRPKNFYQMDPDRFGRLYVSARRLASLLAEKTSLQPEIVVYIASPKVDAYYYPRYYIKHHSWNYLRFQLREIKLLPWNADCFLGGDDHGKTACYLGKWLCTRLVKPFNCTLLYLHHRTRGYEICDPEVIIRNSAAVYNVEMTGYNIIKCLPACDRKDLKFTFFSNTGAKMGTPNGRTPAFRFETSFINMEYERYEEIHTTSVPGFVSQIGGQTNIFMGFTVLTVVQFVTSIATVAVRRMCCRERSPGTEGPTAGGLRGLAQKYMSRSGAVQS